MVSVWAEKFNRQDRLLYVFEDGAQGKGEARRLLEESKSVPRLRGRHLIHSFTFEDKHDPRFVPLQAADFLAYESYRQLDNRILEGIKRPERGALRCLLYRDDPKYTYVRSDSLPTPLFGVFMDEEKINETVIGLELNFPDGPGERV